MKRGKMDQETADWLNRIMVPIHHAGVHMAIFGDNPPTLINIILLDATGRPDLVDLRRVLETEGWEIETESPPPYYFFDPPSLIIATKMTSPVSCEFAFDLPWEGNEGFFELLKETGTIYLSPGETIENVLQQGHGTRINKEDVVEALEHWKAPPTQ